MKERMKERMKEGRKDMAGILRERGGRSDPVGSRNAGPLIPTRLLSASPIRNEILRASSGRRNALG